MLNWVDGWMVLVKGGGVFGGMLFEGRVRVGESRCRVTVLGECGSKEDRVIFVVVC